MLVLGRKESQTIRIGDEIEVTVVAVQGSHVRLGISAPKHVPIRRSEVALLSAPLLNEAPGAACRIDWRAETPAGEIRFPQ